MISKFGKLYVLNEGFDKSLASKFSKARISRENASYASYDAFYTFNEETAKYHIDLAEKFIIESKKFLP